MLKIGTGQIIYNFIEVVLVGRVSGGDKGKNDCFVAKKPVEEGVAILWIKNLVTPVVPGVHSVH